MLCTPVESQLRIRISAAHKNGRVTPMAQDAPCFTGISAEERTFPASFRGFLSTGRQCNVRPEESARPCIVMRRGSRYVRVHQRYRVSRRHASICAMNIDKYAQIAL